MWLWGLLLPAVLSMDAEISATFQQPMIHTDAYEKSSQPVTISCADEPTMANASFPSWKRTWRCNQSEAFDAAKITFINNNASIQFVSLSPSASGTYECCFHAYAYEDYVCYSTHLMVIDNGNDTENVTTGSTTTPPPTTTTAAPLPPAWNVNLTSGETLFCRPEETYFIRVFDINATGISCLVDGKPPAAKMNNKYPHETGLNSDLLIPRFNESLHGGEYDCNATIARGNESFVDMVTFWVKESMDSNLHSALLDPKLVLPYRNGMTSLVGIGALFVTSIWLLYL